jgi:hypothetical protein
MFRLSILAENNRTIVEQPAAAGFVAYRIIDGLLL